MDTKSSGEALLVEFSVVRCVILLALPQASTYFPSSFTISVFFSEVNIEFWLLLGAYLTPLVVQFYFSKEMKASAR